MPYTLAYKDRYRRVAESLITSDTSDSVAFVTMPDNEPTQLIAEWTGKQYTKLLSAVYMGANLMFPEEANEIVWQLIKVAHQPIAFELPEGSGCIEYSPSAGFISFSPDSPFISGDKSDGWNKEAWFRWNEFDTIFPDWIDNWLGGLIEAITGYQAGDILFNIESIPINPIDAFLSGGGLLPKIEIRFTGSGVVEIELLSFPLGGKAIVELDNEPNILDILTGGVIDPAAVLIELARDIVNFPPDEYPVHNVEIPVETTGDHVLYIVFIPIVDDSLLPIGFGGGFRGVELCGFEEEAVVMGIDSIVWDGCALKSISGGVETEIVTAAEIQACMDIPEGGGGVGLGVLNVVTRLQSLGANRNTTSTSFVTVTGSNFDHYFTKPNALVICTVQANLNISATAQFRPVIAGATAQHSSVGQMIETTVRNLQFAESFEDISEGTHEVRIEFKTSASTVNVLNATPPTFIIIEYDEQATSPLDFVEDIQVLSDGTIQKKIGGVWLDVSIDLATLLNSIQATASSAAAAAAAAQSTANTATTVNATQTAQIAAITIVNNSQAALLTAHEARLDDIDLSIAGMIVKDAEQDGRLDALEAEVGGGSDLGAWGGYRLRAITDINALGGKYSSSGNSWDSGSFPFDYIGWIPDGAGKVVLEVENAAKYNSMVFCRVGILVSSWTGGYFRAKINAGEWGNLKPNSSGFWTGWVKIPNVIDYISFTDQNLEVTVEAQSPTDDWRLKSFVWCYINVNPFDGTTSD